MADVSRTVHQRPLASRDIEAIFSYINDRSPSAADRFIDELDSALRMLAEMPSMGSLVRCRGRLRGLRSWPLTRFGPYVVFYMPTENGIDLIRVLHGARDVVRELRKA